jgi:undecaprenyl-diphosphatase
MLAPALIAFVLAVLVLVLSDLTAFHWLRGGAAHFDAAVRAGVHSEASPPLTEACEAITWLGTWPVLPALAIALFLALWQRGRKDLAWFPLAALGAASALLEVTKEIVRRIRPHPWFGLHTPTSWSFPSGHALDSTTCYLVFAAVLITLIRSHLLRAIVIAFAIALPLMIGFTRVYLGVHWPTDVLAGWVAGFCLATGLIVSHGRAAKRSGRHYGQ